MKFLQKLGKSLMLPVACLPICGLLMGIGYALCPSTMQGGDVTGFVQLLGLFLVKAGAALIDNMAILFVIGVEVVSLSNSSITCLSCSEIAPFSFSNCSSKPMVQEKETLSPDNGVFCIASGKGCGSSVNTPGTTHPNLSAILFRYASWVTSRNRLIGSGFKTSIYA